VARIELRLIKPLLYLLQCSTDLDKRSHAF